MKAGVPIRVPVRVACSLPPTASRSRAMPKSRTFTVPSTVRNTFAGFRSRWMMAFSCAATSTSSSWMASAVTTRDERRRPDASHTSSTDRPRRELHHQERRAVLGDVVVDHQHRAGVLDRVADVALAQEALLQVVAQRQLGVQELDRELGLVPVRGGVDGGHASDAEHAVEAVLAPQRRPQPCVGSGAKCRFLLVHRSGRVLYDRLRLRRSVAEFGGKVRVRGGFPRG